MVSLPVEYLDGVVQTDIDVAISIHTYSVWLMTREGVQMASIGVGDLDSTIATVSEDKAVWMGISSCADVQWMGVSIFTTGSLSDSSDEVPLGIEYLDLMAAVRNVNVVLMIHTNTSGIVESSIFHIFPADDESMVMSRMRETRSFGHGHDV
jgi:hypothetical protein